MDIDAYMMENDISTYHNAPTSVKDEFIEFVLQHGMRSMWFAFMAGRVAGLGELIDQKIAERKADERGRKG